MSKWRSPVIAVLAFVVVGATVAVAANPSSGGKITACVKQKTGAMRLASSNGSCKSGERKLSWNQQGRPGADGAKGQSGTNGTNGQNGTNGTNGTNGADASITTRNTAADEVATTSSAPATALNGPTVTVDVPAGGAIVVLGANYDGKNSNGANNSCVDLFEGSKNLAGLGCVQSDTYVRGHGAFTTAADAGSHTYTIKYDSPSSSTASFQNRTLIASVLK
jgi:hypothetical protein